MNSTQLHLLLAPVPTVLFWITSLFASYSIWKNSTRNYRRMFLGASGIAAVLFLSYLTGRLAHETFQASGITEVENLHRHEEFSSVLFWSMFVYLNYCLYWGTQKRYEHITRKPLFIFLALSWALTFFSTFISVNAVRMAHPELTESPAVIPHFDIERDEEEDSTEDSDYENKEEAI